MAKFVEARLKIQRARHHVDDVNRRILAFVNETPHQIIIREDAKSGKWALFFEGGGTPDPMIGVVCGEAVQNARTALDYAIGELIASAAGKWPSADAKFEFPIYTNAGAYKEARKRKLDGVPPAACALIDAYQPCNRPNLFPPERQVLWRLHRLNIEDKHRRLHMLASGLAAWSVSYVGIGGEEEKIDQVNRWIFPLENGAIIHPLSVDMGEPKPNVNGDLELQICFDNPPESSAGRDP